MARPGLFDSIAGWFASGRSADPSRVGEVMGRHAEELMRMRGVMSVSAGATADGEPAIVVGVDEARIGLDTEFPHEIEGVPIVAQEISRPDLR